MTRLRQRTTFLQMAHFADLSMAKPTRQRVIQRAIAEDAVIKPDIMSSALLLKPLRRIRRFRGNDMLMQKLQEKERARKEKVRAKAGTSKSLMASSNLFKKKMRNGFGKKKKTSKGLIVQISS